MTNPPTITTNEGTWHHVGHGMYQLEGKGLAWGRHYIGGSGNGTA